MCFSNTGIEVVAAAALPVTGAEEDLRTPRLTTGQSLDTLDSDDTADLAKSPGINLGINSGSGSGSDTCGGSTSTSIKSPNSSSAHSRFWKLYPRPRNLIRRRATVTVGVFLLLLVLLQA